MRKKVEISYFVVVLLFMFVLPIASVLLEWLLSGRNEAYVSFVGKWFLFWAVGLRLLTAGVRQAANPTFTLKSIFDIQNTEATVVVRELGFANICVGLAGTLSLFLPPWRVPAAFAGGLYMGLAGFQHLFKKKDSGNEAVATVSDLFIFAVMAVYVGFSV